MKKSGKYLKATGSRGKRLLPVLFMEVSGYLTLNDEEITLSEDTAVMPAQSILVLR
ncbi:MAG: hypothetical protein LUF35_00075 [Lachnospiraceae bacterium]|nr:hypothetical protein [Lachnospiraceae bacterium]